MITLAFDPSLTAFGWAVFQNDMLLACGCIETKPIKGKKTDSDTERIKTIARSLQGIIEQYKVDQIVSESPMGSKSSTANKALSMVKGMVIAIFLLNSLSLTWVTARQAKLATTGNATAEKDEVMDAVIKAYPDFEKLTKKQSKKKKEAASDAISVYIATL